MPCAVIYDSVHTYLFIVTLFIYSLSLKLRLVRTISFCQKAVIPVCQREKQVALTGYLSTYLNIVLTLTNKRVMFSQFCNTEENQGKLSQKDYSAYAELSENLYFKSYCLSPRFNLSLYRNSSKSVQRFSCESVTHRQWTEVIYNESII